MWAPTPRLLASHRSVRCGIGCRRKKAQLGAALCNGAGGRSAGFAAHQQQAAEGDGQQGDAARFGNGGSAENVKFGRVQVEIICTEALIGEPQVGFAIGGDLAEDIGLRRVQGERLGGVAADTGHIQLGRAAMRCVIGKNHFPVFREDEEVHIVGRSETQGQGEVVDAAVRERAEIEQIGKAGATCRCVPDCDGAALEGIARAAASAGGCSTAAIGLAD